MLQRFPVVIISGVFSGLLGSSELKESVARADVLAVSMCHAVQLTETAAPSPRAVL